MRTQLRKKFPILNSEDDFSNSGLSLRREGLIPVGGRVPAVAARRSAASISDLSGSSSSMTRISDDRGLLEGAFSKTVTIRFIHLSVLYSTPSAHLHPFPNNLVATTRPFRALTPP